MPAITVTPVRPRPKTSAISGVIATSGTDRNTIAIGMNGLLDRALQVEHDRAHAARRTVPATRPTPASRRVVTDAW